MPCLLPQHVADAAKSKAIVVIPGIGGTSLKESGGDHLWFSFDEEKLQRLECDENGSSVHTIVSDNNSVQIVELSCVRLKNFLSWEFSSEYDVKLFKYDWRLGCADAASKLQQFLTNYNEVIIVAHSMGGLVASKFLALSSTNRAKVSKVITIGTPFTGAVKGLYVMETGDFTFLLPSATQQATIKTLVSNYPSVYELLPTADYLNGDIPYISRRGGEILLTTHSSSWGFMKNRPWGKKASGYRKTMFDDALDFHESLKIGEDWIHVANGLTNEFHMIVGFGEDTPSRVVYNADGTVQRYELNNNGDGTVSTASAVYNRGSNTVLHVRASHISLPGKTSVKNKVRDIINGTGSSIPSTISMNQVDLFKATIPTTNEKGWLIGEDNDRTEVLVYSGKLEQLKTSNGESLIIDGESILLENKDGTRIRYGTVWSLGNDSYQYIFRNHDISFIAHPFNSQKCNMEISYLSNGYFTKSEICPNVSTDLSIAVSSNLKKNILCVDKSGKLVNFTERTEQDLLQMNQGGECA